MIVQRVSAGLDRARARGVTLGPRGLTRGRRRLSGGRIAKGDKGKHKIAAEFGVGSGTVARIKAEMATG